MMDYPELPAFLDRRKNGVTTKPVTEERKVTRKRRVKKLPPDAVLIYTDKRGGLAAGWHYVTADVGRKWVRVTPVGRKRGFRISRVAWERTCKRTPECLNVNGGATK